LCSHFSEEDDASGTPLGAGRGEVFCKLGIQYFYIILGKTFYLFFGKCCSFFVYLDVIVLLVVHRPDAGVGVFF